MSNESGAPDAPRRLTPAARTWLTRTIIVVAFLVVAAIAVWVARALRETAGVQDFIAEYPGTTPLPDWAPVGFPAWVSWTHFLSAFMLLLIVRTGLELRRKQRPAHFYKRDNTGRLKTKGQPVRIGLPLWFHLSLDAVWVLTGVVYVVLLFSTGQWVRIVPTSWDVIPNAVSAGLQYVSFDWPHEDGWVNYNSLQLITYFITVFIASPLAIATGLRLSPGLAARFRRFDKTIPLKATRLVHVWVMVYFIVFTATHVFLVFTTGILRNLNHMYANRDDDSWIGFWIFAASVAVMAAGWFAARPPVLKWLAGLTGTVR
nr:cytochrome b/b6 domain-containing protein [Herbiconiux sp. L3-i23]